MSQIGKVTTDGADWAFNTSYGARRLKAKSYTPDTDETITGFSIYLDPRDSGSPVTIPVAVYRTDTEAVVGASSIVAGPAFGVFSWYSVNGLEIPLLPGVTYKIGFGAPLEGSVLLKRESFAGGSEQVASPSLPDPWVGGTNVDYEYPFYANVESAYTAPSITTADNITSEGQTATFTLSGNSAAPVSATLNGTDVGTLTDQGSGVYSYTAPLIADDAAATLSVSVDGTTADATISYANSYDRDQLTHPATGAEYSENSLSYPNAYATTQPYEWKVIADANASVVIIDWAALEADDGFHKDVASYATPVANGVTTVTLGVFVPETGQAYQFDRTITVSDGSVVVEGEGLFRSLFSALEKSLFKPLFR